MIRVTSLQNRNGDSCRSKIIFFLSEKHLHIDFIAPVIVFTVSPDIILFLYVYFSFQLFFLTLLSKYSIFIPLRCENIFVLIVNSLQASLYLFIYFSLLKLSDSFFHNCIFRPAPDATCENFRSTSRCATPFAMNSSRSECCSTWH